MALRLAPSIISASVGLLASMQVSVGRGRTLPTGTHLNIRLTL